MGDSLRFEEVDGAALGNADDRFLVAGDEALITAASRLGFRALIDDFHIDSLNLIYALEALFDFRLVGVGGNFDGDFVRILEKSHALFGDVRIKDDIVIVLIRSGEDDFLLFGFRRSGSSLFLRDFFGLRGLLCLRGSLDGFFLFLSHYLSPPSRVLMSSLVMTMLLALRTS